MRVFFERVWIRFMGGGVLRFFLVSFVEVCFGFYDLWAWCRAGGVFLLGPRRS